MCKIRTSFKIHFAPQTTCNDLHHIAYIDIAWFIATNLVNNHQIGKWGNTKKDLTKNSVQWFQSVKTSEWATIDAFLSDGRTQNVGKVFLKEWHKKLQTCLARSTLKIVISHQVRWIENRHWSRRLNDCFLNMTSCSCSTKSYFILVLGSLQVLWRLNCSWRPNQIVVTNGECGIGLVIFCG